MLRISSSLLPVTSFLTEMERQQLPFAEVLALTKLALEGRKQVADQAARVFDRPKPTTVDPGNKGPMFIKLATKRDPVAEVRVKDRPQVKGDPALVYLSHAITGGARVEKRSEFLLRKFGVLPRGYYIVPGSGATLDRYGNVSNGQIQQILSFFRSQRDPTANSIRDDGGKSRSFSKLNARYFLASKTRQNTRQLPEGVWERIVGTRRIQPVLIFVPSPPTYSKRLNFYEIQQEVCRTLGPDKFTEAMRVAILTAKFKPGLFRLGSFVEM